VVLPDRRDGEDRDGRDREPGPPFAAFYPWLLIATGAALSVTRGQARPAWAAGGGLVIFAILYMAAIWMRMKARRQRPAVALLSALGAVTLAMTIGFGGDMVVLFPLLSIVCGVVVPWTRRRPPLLPFVAVAVGR